MKYLLPILIILTISFQRLDAAPFSKGHYYTAEGRKVEGQIKLVKSSFSLFGSIPCKVKFRENSKSKTVVLSIDDMIAFVVENDSFALVYNIKINSIQGAYVKDFAQVSIVGPMNLLIHKSTSGDGRYIYNHERYVLSKNNNEFLGIWNEKKQRDEIADFFSSNLDLKQKILDKNYEIDIPELVREYNKVVGR